eukprot:Opistho-2@19996
MHWRACRAPTAGLSMSMRALKKIGEGTFGEVYKARDVRTNAIVALKLVVMENESEGFPITAMREIQLLQTIRDDNDESNRPFKNHIVNLVEIVSSKATEQNRFKGMAYMVFEFMQHDLTGLIESGVVFEEGQRKSYLKQILMGLYYLARNNIVHRDIKGANILLNNRGEVKIADFGLARQLPSVARGLATRALEVDVDNERRLTNKVVTLWYRPPELLLGARHYGPAIDVWAVGCIFTEMFRRRVLFPGQDEVSQMDLICQRCGTPTERDWPGVSSLSGFSGIGSSHTRTLRSSFAQHMSPEGLDLLERMLTMDPARRISAGDALDHDYFYTAPAPTPLDRLPEYPDSHELDMRNRRRQQA